MCAASSWAGSDAAAVSQVLQSLRTPWVEPVMSAR